MPTPLTFADAVAHFRAQEQVEDILLILGKDREQIALRRLLLAWPKCPVTSPAPSARFSEGDWAGLWAAVTIDLPQLGRLSGTGRAAADYLALLQAHRLVYPDGSISATASKALKQLAKTELGL